MRNYGRFVDIFPYDYLAVDGAWNHDREFLVCSYGSYSITVFGMNLCLFGDQIVF